MFGKVYSPADLMSATSKSRSLYLSSFEEVCKQKGLMSDYIYSYKWRIMHYMDGKYSLLHDLEIINLKTYVTLYEQLEEKLNEIYERTVKKENE